MLNEDMIAQPSRQHFFEKMRSLLSSLRKGNCEK